MNGRVECESVEIKVIIDGLNGARGPKGDPGYTPQKGIDYWTDEDKVEMTDDIVVILQPKFDAVGTAIEDLDHRVDTLDNETLDIYQKLEGKQDKGDYALKSDIPVVDVNKSYVDTSVGQMAQQLGRGISDVNTRVDGTNARVENIASDVDKKQNKLTAGANITIEGDVISATGSGSSNVDDVQINGTSIVQDGVANIPYASDSNVGVVKANSEYGLYVNSISGLLTLAPASESYISAKTNNYRPITPKTVDYAVKSGLADSKIEWTDEEKAMAQQRMGILSSEGVLF